MNHHYGAASFMVWPTCTEDSACVADFICRRNCVSWFSDVIVNWKGIESTLPMCMHYRENIQAYTTVLKQTFSISNQCLLLLLLHEGHASKASCADWRKQDRRWTSSLPPLYLAGSTWSPALFVHYPTRLIGVRCSGGSRVAPLYGTVSTLTFEQFKTSV